MKATSEKLIHNTAFISPDCGRLSRSTVPFGHFGHLRKAGAELGYEGVHPSRHLEGEGSFPPSHALSFLNSLSLSPAFLPLCVSVWRLARCFPKSFSFTHGQRKTQHDQHLSVESLDYEATVVALL